MEQYLELESLGILRQTKLPQELSWMTDAQKQLMLQVMLCGEDGLHKREVARFNKKNEGELVTLEFKDYLRWESDKAGKPTFLVLTWKGDEVAKLLMQVARHESRKAVLQAQREADRAVTGGVPADNGPASAAE